MKSVILLICATAICGSLLGASSDDELNAWRQRASKVSVGMSRSEVERIIPAYSPPLSTSGRLALSNSLSIAITSTQPVVPNYIPRTAIVSGPHVVERYSVTPDIIVTINYGSDRVLSKVTVELRSPLDQK